MSTPDNRSVNFFSLFRLKFTHAGIVVAGQAFCNAITPCYPQLVL